MSILYCNHSKKKVKVNPQTAELLYRIWLNENQTLLSNYSKDCIHMKCYPTIGIDMSYTEEWNYMEEGAKDSAAWIAITFPSIANINNFYNIVFNDINIDPSVINSSIYIRACKINKLRSKQTKFKKTEYLDYNAMRTQNYSIDLKGIWSIEGLYDYDPEKLTKTYTDPAELLKFRLKIPAYDYNYILEKYRELDAEYQFDYVLKEYNDTYKPQTYDCDKYIIYEKETFKNKHSISDSKYVIYDKNHQYYELRCNTKKWSIKISDNIDQIFRNEYMFYPKSSDYNYRMFRCGFSMLCITKQNILNYKTFDRLCCIKNLYQGSWSVHLDTNIKDPTILTIHSLDDSLFNELTDHKETISYLEDSDMIFKIGLSDTDRPLLIDNINDINSAITYSDDNNIFIDIRKKIITNKLKLTITSAYDIKTNRDYVVQINIQGMSNCHRSESNKCTCEQCIQYLIKCTTQVSTYDSLVNIN
jgi:hypothetical protein